MENEKDFPKRKNIRLADFDYSTPGAYFITVCTHNRKSTLSHVVGAIHESPAIKLTEYGKIVDKFINSPPEHLKAKIKRYIIMPNHIHMIIEIPEDEEMRAIRESPLQSRSVVSKLVGYIKMNSSKEIHNKFGNATVWQRSFYDHLIRNRHDYIEIAKYIEENPAKWREDELYSE